MSASVRILRMKQLCEKTGLRKSALYSRMNPKAANYDPSFPKPVKLGNSAAVGFVESEVDAWLDAQIQASRSRAA